MKMKWNFITVIKIDYFGENSSMWWKYSILMEVYHCDGNLSIINMKELKKVLKIFQGEENISLLRIVSLWWKFIIVKKTRHCDEYSSVWWKFITEMKIYWLWWKSITLMKFFFAMKIGHCNDNLLIVMKIYHCYKNWSLWWKIW